VNFLWWPSNHLEINKQTLDLKFHVNQTPFALEYRIIQVGSYTLCDNSSHTTHQGNPIQMKGTNAERKNVKKQVWMNKTEQLQIGEVWSEQGGWLPYGRPSLRSLKDLSTPWVHEIGGWNQRRNDDYSRHYKQVLGSCILTGGAVISDQWFQMQICGHPFPLMPKGKRWRQKGHAHRGSIELLSSMKNGEIVW